MMSSGHEPPFRHGGDDLIERHDLVLKLAQAQTQGQEGRGHLARHRDLVRRQRIRGHPLAADHDGPIPVADARAAWVERVILVNIGIGMQGDGGQVQLAFTRTLVEGFDVLQDVFVNQVSGVDLAFCQAIEHEGVIGIGAVSECDSLSCHGLSS